MHVLRQRYAVKQTANRRQTLIVNAVQQRRIIMSAILAGIILINILTTLGLLFTPELLNKLEPVHIFYLGVIEILIVGFIYYLSLLLSHKIIGPAYAIERDLRKIANGDLTVRTRLREADFHLDVAEALRVAAETLSTRINIVQKKLDSLSQHAHLDATSRKMIEEIKIDLSRFKTEKKPADVYLAQSDPNPASVDAPADPQSR